ncbi:hypothetical protein GCM10009551_028270 [Nocardiopsis tropica]
MAAQADGSGPHTYPPPDLPPDDLVLIDVLDAEPRYKYKITAEGGGGEWGGVGTPGPVRPLRGREQGAPSPGAGPGPGTVRRRAARP